MNSAQMVEQAGNVSLIAATVALLDIEEGGGNPLAAALGVREPVDWPPEHNDTGTREWTRRLFRANPGEPGYGTWYVVGDGRLCGTAGNKGPPQDGWV